MFSALLRRCDAGRACRGPSSGRGAKACEPRTRRHSEKKHEHRRVREVTVEADGEISPESERESLDESEREEAEACEDAPSAASSSRRLVTRACSCGSVPATDITQVHFDRICDAIACAAHGQKEQCHDRSLTSYSSCSASRVGSGFPDAAWDKEMSKSSEIQTELP